jgi:chemotaxis protein methyltransferase CheR
MQFQALADLLKQETAVVIDDGREYLIEARLTQIAHTSGFTSLTEMIEQVLSDPGSNLSRTVLLALTTAETSFFRDTTPFEALKSVIIPQTLERCGSAKNLSIWSAGCASGQEVYSLAILLSEHFPEWQTWKTELAGSDINPALLMQAKAGTYSPIEVKRGLSQDLLDRYFICRKDNYQVLDEIRRRVVFHERNILESWYPFKPDIIMCRNTLIYFDLSTRRRILERFYRILPEHGYLVMGTAESPRHLHPGFRPAEIQGGNIFVKRKRDSSTGYR